MSCRGRTRERGGGTGGGGAGGESGDAAVKRKRMRR